jgi:thiol-disulfide isomerase/thioredoxin
MASLLERPLVRMPHFGRGVWRNTPYPLSRDRLRGRVVLVDFWDYSCVNCLRGLPYLRAWHERYQADGLVIAGVHTPEFRFGVAQGAVDAALAHYEIEYPVLLDNDEETWQRYANKAWPTRYLIDPDGYIRLIRQGEGYYQEIEAAIQELLRARTPGVRLPPLLPPLSPVDAPGAVCYRTTPELYAGYQGGGLFGSALGNAEGYARQGSILYTLPPEREPGQFFIEGFWRAGPEMLTFAGQQEGRIAVPYEAAGANAVLSPSDDNVALLLDLPGSSPVAVELALDGLPLTPALAGEDVRFDEAGRAWVLVDRPRLYALTQHRAHGRHELTLICRQPGLSLYTFTFARCVVDD